MLCFACERRVFLFFSLFVLLILLTKNNPVINN
jgi:hypothetical protein